MIKKQQLLVVGNGPTGFKFLEQLTDSRGSGEFEITAIGEEPRPAYDRVHLTDYFKTRNADDLIYQPLAWYKKRGIRLLTGERGSYLNVERRLVQTNSGKNFAFDKLVLATGSLPFVPEVPGVNLPGVFVYRTLADLAAIAKYAQGHTRAAVIGGGLLGLEAAKAVRDLGLEAHVVEFAERLMGRQLDGAAAALLRAKVERMGVRVHLQKNTKRILQQEDGLYLDFGDSGLTVDLVIFSAGIRPRDDLARSGGLVTHPRGGIVVDDCMLTSDPNIYAIGECAVHNGTVYGLVAPCFKMAEVAVEQILGGHKRFQGADLSTTLKLLGVDVATVGETVLANDIDPESFTTITLMDEVQGIYKKMIINRPDNTLRGAILVGSNEDYARLLQTYRSRQPLPEQPIAMIVQGSGAAAAVPAADHALICTCNNVTRGQLATAVQAGAHELAALCSTTKAGTGCGGCKPQVKEILAAELKQMGVSVAKKICDCLPLSRRQLFDVVKVRGLSDYNQILDQVGRGNGCEVCKPAVASILASIYAETAAKTPVIQDTNDRFLANIQRGGTYSVVPRLPGGEITPDRLIVLGQIAKKYNLYTKITGGQRIDLFGARVDQLPEIWQELIAAGFESGHAYAKGMRTIKSCVGSTWCRYGVLDSVSFAIRLEHRYKGVRFPHKVKSAVSGCIRECAEARSKDFGIIATEHGWNLYVCGNGGVKPRHADLLAAGLDDETCIRYIDRFLMFYVYTADPLMRTSTWLEQLEGGLDYLKHVVVDDGLGLGQQLEADMQKLVDAYQCEWKQVVENPELRSRFKSFINRPGADPSIEFVSQRGQIRPASGGGFVELQRIGFFEPHRPAAY